MRLALTAALLVLLCSAVLMGLFATTDRVRAQPEIQASRAARTGSPEEVLLREGDHSPRPVLRDTNGHAVHLGDGDAPVGLLFVNPQCPYCGSLEEEMRTMRVTQGSLVLVVSANGEQAAARRLVGRKGVVAVPDSDGLIAAEYGVTGVPTAFLLDKDGVVLGSARGVPRVKELLRTVIQ